MNSINIIGKYLDQPLLVSKFSKTIPAALTVGAIAYGVHNVKQAEKGDKMSRREENSSQHSGTNRHLSEKTKAIIQNICVLGFTISSALISTRGLKPLKLFGKQVFKGIGGLSNISSPAEVKKAQSALIETFMGENELNDAVSSLLNKAKSKVLKFSEIKFLNKELSKTSAGSNFFREFIPDPESVDAKKILSEIGRLSIIGLIPVVGGVTGGVLGDKLTEKRWKEKVPDKIKEGAYQYLANIFLCNIGAGAALGVMEKMKVTSKAQKALGMIVGIVITGVVGGSAIANFIGKKFINPIFDKKHDKNSAELYSERTPEAVDIGMHTDDIATVAVMSGLRWIEPALPILYSVSGYRAGIGYRNGGHNHHNHHKHHKSHKDNETASSPVKEASFRGDSRIENTIFKDFKPIKSPIGGKL